MSTRILCAVCGRVIQEHESYVVRIDIFADPAMPPITVEELEKMDFDATLAGLLEQMRQMSPEELQDQVHRRFEYRLCRLCQIRFLTNPLGLPRVRKLGGN